MASSFSRGKSRSTWIEPPTMGKQLVNFITAGRVYPFYNLQNRARNHTPYSDRHVYELLGNPTTQLIEPPGP